MNETIEALSLSRGLADALHEAALAIPAAGRHAAAACTEPDDGLVFTGEHGSLVITTIPPGADLGTGKCQRDQIVVLLSGEGEHVADGVVERFTADTAVCVRAGTRHNIRNTGIRPMRLAAIHATAA